MLCIPKLPQLARIIIKHHYQPPSTAFHSSKRCLTNIPTCLHAYQPLELNQNHKRPSFTMAQAYSPSLWAILAMMKYPSTIANDPWPSLSTNLATPHGHLPIPLHAARISVLNGSCLMEGHGPPCCRLGGPRCWGPGAAAQRWSTMLGWSLLMVNHGSSWHGDGGEPCWSRMSMLITNAFLTTVHAWWTMVSVRMARSKADDCRR